MSVSSPARLAKHPLVPIALSFAFGILGYRALPNRVLAVVAVPCALVLCLLARRIHQRVPVIAVACLLVSFFCTGYVASCVESSSISADRMVRLFEQGVLTPNEPVELMGRLDGEPESTTDGIYLNLKAEEIRSRGRARPATGNVLLLAHLGDQFVRKEYDGLQLHHGARIRVMTELDRDEDYRNPGVMPFTEYLERRGYDATGVIKSPLLIERLEDAQVFLPEAWIYEWRARLERQFDRYFSTETAGVLDAVLLGNRNKISREVADRFREGGTFHVLVIAGLHIGFIAGLLFLLMRRFTRNRAIQFFSVVSIVFVYSFAVGAPTPVIRAALVFSLGILAPLVWRRAHALNIIAGAALVLLIWRPSDLLDPSFQLTFLSVISIVAIAVPIMTRMQAVGSWRPTHDTPYPPSAPTWFLRLSEVLFWSEKSWKAEIEASNIRYRLFKTRWAARFERWHFQRPLRFALAAVLLSASVQIGMLPLLIVYFHRVSFASLVLNIFVGLAMIALAFVALMATVLAQFSSTIATPFIFLSEKIERLMVHLVDPFHRFGIAAIRLPHYHGSGVFIYGFYFLALGVLVLALARWNPLRPGPITGETDKRIRPSRVKFAAALLILFLGTIVFHPFSGPRPDGRLHIDYLDVGQGDSALLTMPDGATLLIDGGGRPNIDWNRADEDAEQTFERDTRSIGERVVSEYLWARGMDRVDYILPTHADADHIDGLNDVARNFKVRGAIVARTPRDDREYERFQQTMKDSGVAIEKIGADDQLRFGDVAIDVLWPAAKDEVSEPWRNNDGTVLRVRFGTQSFLFAADIEKEAEALILQTRADLHSDIVKVAHHGSRTSSTANFINATGASMAIISVGRTSIFGHPHAEVVDRWRGSGAQVMTTGEKGTISVVTDGGQFKVSTFVK